jgi:PilZ domain
MTPNGIRRSDRISLTMHLEAAGKDRDGHEFVAPARTMLVSRYGAAILLPHELHEGQEFVLRRRSGGAQQESRVRIVARLGGDVDGRLYGVAALEPEPNLWGIEFPSELTAEDGVTHVLLECSSCQTRQIAALTELDLKVFEAHHVVARPCKVCQSPTVWKQAAGEASEQLPATQAPRKPAESESPLGARWKPRVQTRLPACIRQAGQPDDVGVCENISRSGLCFRSLKRYAKGSRIEVAVPYSQGAANVFLSANIIYVQELVPAGLFRHGAAYVLSGSSASQG